MKRDPTVITADNLASRGSSGEKAVFFNVWGRLKKKQTKKIKQAAQVKECEERRAEECACSLSCSVSCQVGTYDIPVCFPEPRL